MSDVPNPDVPDDEPTPADDAGVEEPGGDEQDDTDEDAAG